MLRTVLEKFNADCEEYYHAELSSRLLAQSSAARQASSDYYLHELQRCVDEQTNCAQYMQEQITSLESLKSCESSIDAFLGRLKAVHEYELKQNDIFEHILHELTKLNPSSQEERLQLLGQIDELIVCKAQLTGDERNSSNLKLVAKSSDTFKNIL